ncbi:unnamed protein product, partial [Ectocarpus sp. 12 AP-2014]
SPRQGQPEQHPAVKRVREELRPSRSRLAHDGGCLLQQPDSSATTTSTA